MRETLEAARYQGASPELVVRHIYLSGGFNEPFMSALLDHTGTTGEHKAAFIQAVAAAKRNDGTKDFDTALFCEQTALLPKEDLLAYSLAATQRFFQPQVIVSLQNPTDYSTKHGAEILALSDQMGMRAERHVNLTPETAEAVHVGVCIGGMSRGANDYLKRQHRILTSRTNSDEPYQLFLLTGNRKLTAGDELSAPTADFTYNSEGSYLDYLAAYWQKDKSQLTEGDMMQERQATLFAGAAAHYPAIPIPAQNAEEFMERVAEQLASQGDSTPKTLVVTSYDVFNATYQSMMQTALENHDIHNVSVKCDGGKSIHNDKPQVLIREVAKQINGNYNRVAKLLAFDPHPREKFSGATVATLEKTANTQFNAATVIQRIARGALARGHVEQLKSEDVGSAGKGR